MSLPLHSRARHVQHTLHIAHYAPHMPYRHAPAIGALFWPFLLNTSSFYASDLPRENNGAQVLAGRSSGCSEGAHYTYHG